MSGDSSGSPPVTTAWRVGKPATRASTASMVTCSPSGFHEVYSESQNEHLRLQPVVRTKADGTPARRPSPWIEKKMSETFIGDATPRAGAARGTLPRAPDSILPRRLEAQAPGHEVTLRQLEQPLHRQRHRDGGERAL